MGSVWSYCQGGQLPWSIESHMRGQSNHSNHSVPRATIQVQHYFDHITVKQQFWHKNWFYWGFCETGCSQLDVALHVRGPHVFTVILYIKRHFQTSYKPFTEELQDSDFVRIVNLAYEGFGVFGGNRAVSRVAWSGGGGGGGHPSHTAASCFRLPSSLQYKTHFSSQWNCWSLRCSWSIACRRCSALTTSSFST